MTRRVCLLLILVISVSLVAVAQDHHANMPAGKSDFDKAILQKVWDAWSTLDPANSSKFYSHEPDHVFYDVAPLQYHSWAEYEAGVKPLLAGWKSMRAKVNYDGIVHAESPNMVWSATTVEMDVVTKEGKSKKMTARWTAIWHKHGNHWMIAHEHVSVPMQ